MVTSGSSHCSKPNSAVFYEPPLSEFAQRRPSISADGRPVTDREKKERAVEIAGILGDHKLWHSHGRMIGPQTLAARPLKLAIDDYSADDQLRPLIRAYNDLQVEYMARGGYSSFMHSIEYF